MKPSSLFSLMAAILAVGLAGCGRDGVKVYQVETNNPTANESAAPSAATSPMASMAGEIPTPDNSGLPKLKFALPAGWKEKSLSQLRVASFEVTENGKSADISVIPLSGTAGGDAANVNRWRGQAGLPPLPDEELQKLAEKIEVAGQPADFYDVVPTGEESPSIQGLILHRDDTAWFFKMSGDSELLAKQKANFIAFLKSVEFGGLPAPSTMDLGQLPPSHPTIPGMAAEGTATSGAAADGTPVWTVPAGWQPGELAQFLIARYVITGDGGATAAVNISQLEGDGGGLAANVNRWRKQLGLTPITDAEVTALPVIEAAGQKAVLVEASGKDARTGQPAGLVGVVLPLGGQTWFYKMMGDPGAVAAQKAALIQFVQSARYPAAK